MIWPDIELFPAEFDSAFIEFQVFERNWFIRDYLIGKASLQLNYVNARKNHMFAKRYLDLRREDSTACTGKLNVTVFVLQPGQQPPSASAMEEAADDGQEKGEEQEENLLKSCVLQTKVQETNGKPHHVIINIHRVEDLRYPMNPYVTVEFASNVKKIENGVNVTKYTFNYSVQIPVMTPPFEDTIIVKLWNSVSFGSDELIAQGLISFSELRNKSMPPRWFVLYGWDPNEIRDVTAISGKGQEPEPNYFKGRLLMSGRVERLDSPADMEVAKVLPAKPIAEPNSQLMALLSDVYMVVGAEGRKWGKCWVELSYGSESARTKPDVYGESLMGSSAKGVELSAQDEEDDDSDQVKSAEQVSVFQFSEEKGRIEPLVCNVTEDVHSQPYVMINLYTDTLLNLNKGRRIAYAKRMLHEFDWYDQGNPGKPKFFALDAMPDLAGSRNPPAVLMVIEKHHTDDVLRHARKRIQPMVYILRTYLFAARNISYEGMRPDLEPDFLRCRISCAGMVGVTGKKQGPRPLFMEVLDLKVILSSESTKVTPTIEPITVTLMKEETWGNRDVGKAVCVYTHLRKRDMLYNWEKYDLRPQWVKVKGGAYGNQAVGEILVAFELLLWKDRDVPKLQPREMWPQPSEAFDPRNHFCQLRKVTLHFSLFGLRDLLPLPWVGGLLNNEVSNPVVEVEVPSFRKPDPEETSSKDESSTEGAKLVFEFKETIPQGDERRKADRLLSWRSTKYREGDAGTNFEFFQVKTLNCEIPDKPILQPYVRIRVYERRRALLGIGSESRTLIGESLQGLERDFPCLWYDGVDANKKFEEQRELIEKMVKRTELDARVKDEFQQMSEQELLAMLREARQQERELGNVNDKGGDRVADLVQPPEPKIEDLDDFALPRQLRYIPPGVKRPLKLTPLRDLNLHMEESFSPKNGAAVEISGSAQKTLGMKLECSTEPPFVHDFWYKSVPLLRNTDIIKLDDTSDTAIDWFFQPGRTFGFVKCCYKLVDASLDGWPKPKTDDQEDEPEEVNDDDAELDDEDDEDDREKLKRSLDLNVGKKRELNKYAFTEKKLIKRFKPPEVNRVCVRLSFRRAVCLFGKGSGFADPFLDFQLGRNEHVSCRNMFKAQQNQPQFYHPEERFVILPEDSRLEVRIYDLADVGSFNDTLIGATVIDLEDRWNSTYWRKESSKPNTMPYENRPLFSEYFIGQNRGSIEMCVEMLKADEAADIKPSNMHKPAADVIEVRFIVWQTYNVKPYNGGETTNIKIGIKLDCKEYAGRYPAQQFTDVHYMCNSGEGKFNYRFVYPDIQLPVKSCSAQIMLYHSEAISGDYAMGLVTLELQRHLQAVARENEMIEAETELTLVGFEEDDTKKGEDGTSAGDKEEVGSVKVKLQVMMKTQASGMPAGIGWDEPNQFPVLFTPSEGRDWGTFLSGFGISLPDFWKIILKKLIPLVITAVLFLANVVLLKYMGLM